MEQLSFLSEPEPEPEPAEDDGYKIDFCRSCGELFRHNGGTRLCSKCRKKRKDEQAAWRRQRDELDEILQIGEE